MGVVQLDQVHIKYIFKKNFFKNIIDFIIFFIIDYKCLLTSRLKI